jgi:putative GTP pyrophosphokinase
LPPQRPIHQVAVAAYWLQAEVLNGGLAQFFANDTGMAAPEAVAPVGDTGPPTSEAASAAERELNAFTFLKIAAHFFREFEFEDKKVDGFVQYIQEWSPGITRAQFNRVMKENIARVKRYKQAFEAKDPTNKLNPYTVIRHCLYLTDNATFSKALSKLARESFEEWLGANAPVGPT